LIKIEIYVLARDVLLPKFDYSKNFLIPEDENDGGNEVKIAIYDI
jgi:DNA polymerase-3 subunit alpha